MSVDSKTGYVGFWPRVEAAVLDGLFFAIAIISVLYMIYGRSYFRHDILQRGFVDVLNSIIAPSLSILLFWMLCASTPGKLLISAQIVDAKTGQKPRFRQFVIRYLAYYLSLLVFGLGFLQILFSARKQGWHDRLAGTLVVYRPRT